MLMLVPVSISTWNVHVQAPGSFSILVYLLPFLTCGFRLNEDVLRRIVEHSDTETLLSWRLTSHTLFTLTALTLRSRYLHLLTTFFGGQALQFDNLLHRTGGILSGSLALLFMLWTESWEPGDLDVYISAPAYGDFIATFESTFPVVGSTRRLQRKEGKYDSSKILTIKQYTTQHGKKIDVIQSVDPNPAVPLTHFWTSLVVNFITPQGAVCAYPRSTLRRRGLVLDRPVPTRTVAARAKYEARGMSFEPVAHWIPRFLGTDNMLFADGNLLVLDFRPKPAMPPSELPIRRGLEGWHFRMPYPSDADCEFPFAVYLRSS